MHSGMFISSFHCTRVQHKSVPPPRPHSQVLGPSGAGTGIVGAPDLLGLPVNHQLAFVGQIEATHVAALVG